NKCLCDVVTVFMIIKKARLKVTVSMSCGSTALIVTPSPASLVTVVEVAVPCSGVSFLLLASVSVFSLFPALSAAVAMLPLSTNMMIR
ncbi:hypothetical protein BDFG_04489, partial [Blastomyces dermatitidis ATCC 26199]